MVRNCVPNPNFKGFIVDITQANWNAIWIVYGSGDPSDPRVDREWNCFFIRVMNPWTNTQNNKSS